MNKKEKQLFTLEWAKVHCFKYLDQALDQKFADLKVKIDSNSFILEVYLFKGPKYVDKKELSTKLKAICTKYCPDLTFSVKFMNYTEDIDHDTNPKIYFEKIVRAYKRYNLPPFNLGGLENAPLGPKLQGLRIVVKGKRGARKFKKVLTKGTINYHSLKRELKTYKGILQTNLGIIGIEVVLKQRTPLDQ